MKVPKPRKLKSGSWFIQMRLNGVSVSVTERSKTECVRQAELIKAEYAAGKRQIQREQSMPTLKTVVGNYINKYRSELSPATVRGYRQIADNRFGTYINLPINEIDYQQMVSDELTTKSEKTVKNGWYLIHAALKDFGYAVPDVKLANVPVNEIPFLQPDEVLKFCNAVKGRSYKIPALLELHGMRLSEVYGLTWDKVDLKRKTITIRGARVRGENGYVQKKTNKSKRSTRIIPIMIPQLKNALQSVEDKTGSVVRGYPGNLYEYIQIACRRAGITVVGNHGLRHSFASLGYHLGLSERQLMDIGGWDDYQTMHKIYIRLAQADKKASENAFSDFFANVR